MTTPLEEKKASISQTIDDVSKIGLIVVVLGYLNLYFYYGYFGIPIYQYLETSEIIFSFSSVIQALYYFLIMMVLGRMSHFMRREDTEKMIAKMKRKREEEELRRAKEPEAVEIDESKVNKKEPWWKKVLEKVGIIIFVFVGQIIVYLIFIFVGSFFSDLRLDRHEEQLVFELAFILVIMSINIFAPRGTSKNSLYMGYLVIIIMFIYIRTNASYNAVKDKHPKYSAKLLMNDGTHKNSNDSIMYIGGVRQYHFFYNLRSRESIIIPVSTIKEIAIKELREGI